MKPKLSVILGTYNRAEYLERSLYTYIHGSFDPQDLEVIILDDWSTDQSEPLCFSYAHEIPLIYIRPTYKPQGFWRDSAAIINLGIRASNGEVVIVTHPEMMVGKNTLKTIYEQKAERTWLTAKTYFLSYDQQQHLSEVNWEENILNVRQLPNFPIEDPFIQNTDFYYSHKNMEGITCWDSWQLAGMTRKTWQYQGGLIESDHWGIVDVGWLTQRNALNIHNLTLMDETTYCVHQNHDPINHQIGVNDHRDMPKVESLLPMLASIPMQQEHLW